MLSFLYGDGTGGFTKADDLPPIPVGVGPHRAVKGKFGRLRTKRFAIIDTSPDAAAQAPFVKMLFGRGDGSVKHRNSRWSRKTGPSRSPPAVSATSRRHPLDLVIINGDGKVTLLVNDGAGRPKMLRHFHEGCDRAHDLHGRQSAGERAV